MLLMLLRGQSVRPVLLLVTLAAVAVVASQGENKRKPDPGPPPSVRIEVTALGYVPPSRAYLSYRYSTATLDFIDNNRLLFTFRDAGLMHRVPNDPSADEDQVIDADVLDIANGKVIEKSQWRMHDRSQYLWPLRDGQFIIRQRNSLYLTDSHLELKPYIQFDAPLQAVQVAPDRNLLVLEVQKLSAPDPETASLAGADSFFGPAPRRKRVAVMILHPGERSILAQSEARTSVDLPLVDNGFLNLIEGRDPTKWVIQREKFQSDTQTVGEFSSSCPPTLITVSHDVALAVGCPPKGGSDRLVNAISLTGQVLWQDHWKQRYIWPTFDYAEDGSRFAFGSLELNRDVGFMDAFGQDDVVAQMVGVFDTHTGKMLLAKDASPVLSAGHNYALSRDGRRFAILREGAIEIYDLPPAVVDAPVASVAPGK